MSSVLLVTRDASTERLTESALASAGHEVITADSCGAAIRSLFNVSIDVVVMDSAIGETEMEEFCGWLRSGDGSCPVVFLTAASARWLIDSLPINGDRDEIVIKPCEGNDIRRAVEKTLGSAQRKSPEVLMIGTAALDKNSHELRGDSASVQLTPTEFRLMYYLVRRRGSIVSTKELLEKVWEFFPGTGSSELVRSHVRNLRSKLRIAAGGADPLQTVPRRGYRLI